jgi:hypothetical protein
VSVVTPKSDRIRDLPVSKVITLPPPAALKNAITSGTDFFGVDY